jgi:hypothetical protein
MSPKIDKISQNFAFSRKGKKALSFQPYQQQWQKVL